jgi:CRISPR/Cas system-associated protein endoribonuclease Cas2
MQGKLIITEKRFVAMFFLKRELKKAVKQNNEKIGINGPEVIDEY